jgi:molybdopterin converting factor small subunit
VRVEVRLFASLRDKLPEAPRGRAPLELPDGASLQDLLEHLDVHAREAQMVLVNGVQLPRAVSDRRAHALAEGDVVAIFPPLAGG